MKIYRCVVGCLLVFFIAIGVWYMVSCYNEQRSIEDGTLIWRGEEVHVASHSLC